jgi:hypothetical protein
MVKATLILSEKRVLPDGHIMDIKVWGVPEPVAPCAHPFKYSLFFGYSGVRLIAYDNERGKGDHKHVLGAEFAYAFVSLRRLLSDFRLDVEKYCKVTL